MSSFTHILQIAVFMSAILLARVISAENITATILGAPLKIKDYRAVNMTLKDNDSLIITREITTDGGDTYYYYIDTESLRYGIRNDLKRDMLAERPSGGLFHRIIAAMVKSGKPFGNSSEYHAKESAKYILLTSDLCPCVGKYSSNFYRELERIGRERGIRIPLIVFFSGNWVLKKMTFLEEIKKYDISFIAGNHTIRHVRKKNMRTDLLESEILGAEKIMLEAGLLPSYFFRFPGLVHGKQDIETIARLNIIALDANVWMGMRTRNWGFLLVHSNGVVPSEVRKFISFLNSSIKDIVEKKLVFADIFSYFLKFYQQIP
jgi:peptidoglycan/xylan/chitin deacetylase (PgdA/CDA1 family)